MAGNLSSIPRASHAPRIPSTLNFAFFAVAYPSVPPIISPSLHPNPCKHFAMVYHVYIMASASGVLYIGVTNNLERRVAEHKSKRHASFTANYQITKLVYFEAFGNVKDAISRETQYKKWRRNKKVALIENQNAHWRDLSQDFHPSISL